MRNLTALPPRSGRSCSSSIEERSGLAFQRATLPPLTNLLLADRRVHSDLAFSQYPEGEKCRKSLPATEIRKPRNLVVSNEPEPSLTVPAPPGGSHFSSFVRTVGSLQTRRLLTNKFKSTARTRTVGTPTVRFGHYRHRHRDLNADLIYLI